jgi:hypothetical protein
MEYVQSIHDVAMFDKGAGLTDPQGSSIRLVRSEARNASNLWEVT